MDVYDNSGQNTLFWAPMAGEGEDHAGADVHRARDNGVRPIHDAARNGRDKTVLLFLSLRATVDLQGTDGRTPCWCAAYDGHTRLVSLLLSLRANPNASAAGWTAADVAKDDGHEDTLALILANGGRLASRK